MPPDLSLTTAARRFMGRMVRFGGQGEQAGLRLMVTPGGCSGYNVEFSVVPAPMPGDTTLELDGLRLFVPAETRMLLDGVTVDFAETPTATGLTFLNPGVSPSACGASAPGPGVMPGVTKIEIGAIRRS